MSLYRSEQGLFDAAVESARVFNAVAAECAVTSGLTDAMAEFRSADELSHRLRFHDSKSAAFQAMLRALVAAGIADVKKVGSVEVFRTRRGVVARERTGEGGLQRYEPRLALLAPWFQDEHTELIRSANRALFGADLNFFRSPSKRIRFDNSYLEAWQTNLTNPLYEFGRLLAVRELVARGTRFLDLAGGLGYGAQRLAEWAPDGCEIVLVDKSADFLKQARMAIYPRARMRFVQRDLNLGLPPLGDERFDGVLFNGAFHFIHDKRARLREMHEVLRPGGLLVIGHCYCRSGLVDEEMHDLYFSMLEDPLAPVSFSALRTMVADAGFHELRQYHRGSHAFLLAERDGLEGDAHAW